MDQDQLAVKMRQLHDGSPGRGDGWSRLLATSRIAEKLAQKKHRIRSGSGVFLPAAVGRHRSPRSVGSCLNPACRTEPVSAWFDGKLFCRASAAANSALKRVTIDEFFAAVWTSAHDDCAGYADRP
jgi:hypothetical protein